MFLTIESCKVSDDFCSLHTHSEFSILDGFSNPNDIARLTHEMGQNAVALTDHGTLSGSLRFWKAGREHEIKTIIGMEGYITEDINEKSKDSPTWHLVLLAQSREGLHNLFAISREGWTNGFYRKPRVDHSVLRRYASGIIATSACMAGEVAKFIETQQLDEAKAALLKYKDIFNGRFYVELQPGNTAELNHALANLANSTKLPLVVTVDSHYDTCDRKSTQEMLLVMQQTAGFKASEKSLATYNYEQSRRAPSMIQRLDTLWPNRKLRFDKHDLHLMSRQEVIERMCKQGFDGNALCDTTLEISERCQQVDFNIGTNYLPKITKRFDSDDYLEALVMDGLESRGKHKDQTYIDRVKEELSVIKSKNFSDYFLIVWDIINEARNRNIFVGPGRGSAAGSLVAYCLKITSIDPIKYGLLFFRFIDPSRNDFPDIDMDFEHRRRDEMKEYVAEKYGEALSLSTFTTLKAKSLIRSIARTLCIPLTEVNDVCKLFNELDEFKSSDATLSFRNQHPAVLLMAEDLEGHISASGMHAAALVVADRPMHEIVPIETRTDPNDKTRRVQVCAYEMNDAAEIGLIKFDFLGLNTLTVIHDTLDLIKESHDVDIDWENLEPDDVAVLSDLDHANTVGVFQMESSPYRKLLAEMGVDNFNDLVASNALVRPGAFNTVAKDYIERKNGTQEVSYPHEDVTAELSETYGTYIYQEQVMQLTVKLGGFSWEKANKLRKIIGKKLSVEEFAPYYQPWIEFAGEKIGVKNAEEMWHNFEAHAGYSFNKSHAVCYSYLGYVTAYLKHYYPTEFMYGLLRSEKKDTTRMTYLLEAKRLGIKILAPDVNSSNMDICISNDNLLFGLSDIKGVGFAACEEIIKKRPFKNWDDFTDRIAARKCNSRVVEALVAVNALRNIEGAPRHPSPEDNYQEYLNYPIQLGDVTELGLTFTQLEDMSDDFSLVSAVVKSVKRTNTYVRLELEDVSGNVTCFGAMNNDLQDGEVVVAVIGDNSMVGYTRVSGLRERMQSKSWANQFERVLFDPRVWEEFDILYKFGTGNIGDAQTLVIPLQVRAITTKRGARMAFAYLIDRDLEIVNVVVFPKPWLKVQEYLFDWNPVIVKIKVMDDGAKTIWSDGIIGAREVLEHKRKVLVGSAVDERN